MSSNMPDTHSTTRQSQITLPTVTNFQILITHISIILLTTLTLFKLFHNFNNLFFLILTICFLNLTYISLFSKEEYKSRRKEFITTFILSLLFSFSLFRLIFSQDYFFVQIYIYLISLCVYHFMEYTFVLVFHFNNLKFDSFLINQSREYMLATAISFNEYFIEIIILREWKVNSLHSFSIIIGVAMMIAGHFFRISAMFTAGSNFTHLISFRKKESHCLVTNGVYSLSRHPSYFGFFIWSIGCQIMCLNPICIFGFAYVLWRFFKERIKDEEPLLISFFGEDYIRYRNRVGILIPFIEIDPDEVEKALYFHHINVQNKLNQSSRNRNSSRITPEEDKED